MKIIKRISFFMLLIFLFNACNKDDEPLSETYLNLIGKWSASQLSFNVQINNIPLIQYYKDELGLTDSEAQVLVELFGQTLASGFVGTIEFKNDNTYIADFGGDNENGTWELVNSDQQINLTEAGSTETQEIEIKSVTETTLVIAFDEMDTEDLDGDGTVEELSISLELTLERQ